MDEQKWHHVLKYREDTPEMGRSPLRFESGRREQRGGAGSRPPRTFPWEERTGVYEAELQEEQVIWACLNADGVGGPG